MYKCVCKDCKKEFDWEYKVSICDDCLEKYKQLPSCLIYAKCDEVWKEGENPFKDTEKMDYFKGATAEELDEISQVIATNQFIDESERGCEDENKEI